MWHLSFLESSSLHPSDDLIFLTVALGRVSQQMFHTPSGGMLSVCIRWHEKWFRHGLSKGLRKWSLRFIISPKPFPLPCYFGTNRLIYHAMFYKWRFFVDVLRLIETHSSSKWRNQPLTTVFRFLPVCLYINPVQIMMVDGLIWSTIWLFSPAAICSLN